MVNIRKPSLTSWAHLLRLFLAVSILFTLTFPANATPIKLEEMCDFSSKDDINIEGLFTQNITRRCGKVDNEHSFLWGYFDDLNIKSSDMAPLEFRTTIHRRDDQKIYVRYDDGEIAASPTSKMDARKPYSWGQLAYALPIDNRTINAILIKSEHSHSKAGAAPNGMVLTAQQGAHDDIMALMTYVFMAGALLILLPLTMILYFMSRRRFLLPYAASLVMILLAGIFWSGAATVIFPDLRIGIQEEINALAISLYGVCQVFLMICTFEENMRYKKIEKLLLLAGAVAVAGQCVRIFAPEFHWRLTDNIVYFALATLATGLYICALVSARRGSMIARLYSFVWAMPFIVATLRITWGLGLIDGDDKLILVSPLFMLVGEGFLGALVVGWQVNMLRNERDIAIGREAALITLSETDSLTGLLNRRAFLAKSYQGEYRKSLILVDIDHFKSINDSYGHAIGDDTIQYVAQIMREVSPENSIIGRLGGEEFGILVHTCEADEVAQKLCDAISKSRGSEHPAVTVSCGIAHGFILNEKDWRLLYITADRALYTAKNNGRNQIQPALKNLSAA